MHVRQAALSDVRELADLNRQLIRDEGHRKRMSLAELEARMNGWLGGQYEAHLFSDQGEPVGYVLARREVDHVYIRQFFIDPAYRRRGLGRSALEWMQKNVWHDAPRLRLDVLVGNAAGVAFWHSLGFTDYCLTMERETCATSDSAK